METPTSLESSNKDSTSAVSEANAANLETSLKSWYEIPGPSSLPIIGQLLHFMPGGELQNLEGVEGSLKLFKMYGPIVRFDGLLGKSPMILLFDPESCEHVLRSENKMPLRPGFKSLEYYRKDYKRSKGENVHTTGLVTDHGEIWKDFRLKVNPVMLQPKTIKLYRPVLEEVAQDIVLRLKANRNEENMIRNDFGKEMTLWALEAIGTVALGCRLNCFDPNLPADSPEWQLIQCVHELFVTANELDHKPNLWRYYSTPLFKKAMKLYEQQEELTKYFVNKGKEQFQNNTDTEKGVLEKLLEIDEEVAYIMASDMLFSGVDTAANTVIANLYLLAINPEKQDKLREDIILAKSNSERSRYLNACMKEALRIMPVVSGNLRVTTKEYNLLGYQIPKNVEVVFAHQAMSLLEENYPQPQEYIPERWFTSKEDPLYFGNAHSFARGPFGYGARNCIGQRIAEIEIESFLTYMIENFKVEWFGSPPNISSQALNYFEGPFNFIFKDV